MLSLDALAVVYAYMLSFIILGIIVGSVTLALKLIERRTSVIPEAAAATPASPAPAPPPQQPAAEPPEASLKEIVAAAVAAVAAHLAAQPAAPVGVAPTPPQPAVTGWVYRWRAQVNVSLNELSALRTLRRR